MTKAPGWALSFNINHICEKGPNGPLFFSSVVLIFLICHIATKLMLFFVNSDCFYMRYSLQTVDGVNHSKCHLVYPLVASKNEFLVITLL